MKFLQRALVLSFALTLISLLTGCGTVYEPGQDGPRKLRVVEAQGGEAVPEKFRTKFVQRLDRELYTENFVRGNDLVLNWKCTEVNAGNRALRYFVGFGAGAGVIRIEATVADSKGRILAKKELKGVQTVGMFGGSFDSALEMAADETADFAAEAVYKRR